MSFETGLKAVGLLVVGYFLITSLIATGPIGWVVFGTMIVMGILQVHRKRARQPSKTRDEIDYCPNCGSSIDFGAFDGAEENDAGTDWTVRYCPDCGALIGTDTTPDSVAESSDTRRPTDSANCPACGAPNDPDRTTCKHCDATL